MADFRREHNLRLKECGKLLVVADLQDAPQLDKLADRARQHGIPIEMLDQQQLLEMEPEARSGSGRAIYVPSTAVGDPAAVMQVLKQELQFKKIMLRNNSKIIRVDAENRQVLVHGGDAISYGYAINTAGLNADLVAHQFSCGDRYTLLPLKGIYWKLNPGSGVRFNHLVYCASGLRDPFLGVHTATTVDGATYLGPTAIPAFDRENYRGFQGINLEEAGRIVLLLTNQFTANLEGFRRLAWQEGRRYFKNWFAEAAQAIALRIKAKHLLPTDKVGVRVQMLDKQ